MCMYPVTTAQAPGLFPCPPQHVTELKLNHVTRAVRRTSPTRESRSPEGGSQTGPGRRSGPCPRLLWLRPTPILLAYSITAGSAFLQKPRRRVPDAQDPRAAAAAAALKATVTVASWGAPALPGTAYLEAWPPQHHEARPLPPVTVVSSALVTPIVSTLPLVSHAASRASAEAERAGAEEPDGAAGEVCGAAPPDEHAYHRARLEPEAGLDGVVAALQRKTCLPGGPARPEPAGAGAVAIVCGEQPAAAVLYTLTPAHDP
ncbi:THAP domain-containing protein 8 isoform X2 [Petaurus breviceps papuanus]|uniref:THAP domain-containing protein 8 isoform X2 n=1 Tax=Petaurus breviceps papuanus TaxID=3040969 RepID=UPI0036DC52BB